jgi:hypothetical protein
LCKTHKCQWFPRNRGPGDYQNSVKSIKMNAYQGCRILQLWDHMCNISWPFKTKLIVGPNRYTPRLNPYKGVIKPPRCCVNFQNPVRKASTVKSWNMSVSTIYCRRATQSSSSLSSDENTASSSAKPAGSSPSSNTRRGVNVECISCIGRTRENLTPRVTDCGLFLRRMAQSINCRVPN